MRCSGAARGALAGLVVAGQCACLASQAALQAGAPSEWLEVRTDHFRVRAQLDEPAAVELAQSLEALRAGVLAYWGPGFAPKDLLEVLVYRDASALADFALPQPGGAPVPGFVAQGPGGPMIVTTAGGARDPRFLQVQAHQLAHQLITELIPRAPRWLSEGLAQYLETLTLDLPAGKVTFGKPPGSVRPDDLTGQPITLAQLWDWTTDDELPAQRAAWAWWLVAWLASTHPERFNLWQRAIALGEEPRQGWERSFAGLPDATLEADALAAIELRQLKFRTASCAFKPGQAEVVKVAPADLHATRAELLLQSSPLDFEYRRSAAAAELEAALALDPGHADARVLQVRLISDPREARGAAQRLVEVLPQSAKAWGLLASLLGRTGADPRETLQFALALSPDHPGLINTLAWYSAVYGDKVQALKLAEKAAELRPWSAAMLDTHAAVLAAAGRCAEAAARQRQALELLVHGAAPVRAQYVGKLREYESRCTRAQPTPLRQ